MRFLASSLSLSALCLAAMVVMLGAPVVTLVVGQEAVSSTALSWKDNDNEMMNDNDNDE